MIGASAAARPVFRGEVGMVQGFVSEVISVRWTASGAHAAWRENGERTIEYR